MLSIKHWLNLCTHNLLYVTHYKIMPSTCLICKRIAKKGSNVSMHRILPKSEAVNRQKRLVTLNLTKDDVLEHHRICSQHFRNGDTTQISSLHLSARFALPCLRKLPYKDTRLLTKERISHCNMNQQ